MNKYMKILVWPIALSPLIYLATTWSSLPETMAVHFDLSGTPDRYGNKSELMWTTILLCTLSIAVFYILSNVYRIAPKQLYRVDPEKYAIEHKDRLLKMAFVITTFMSAISIFIIYSASTGGFESGVKYIYAGVGLLFCFMGNYMHTIKPNYFAGFRLPWTLNNEENWKKTHLLAGKMWFGGGILLAILCLLLPGHLARIAFFSMLGILVILPGIYSYRLYKAGNTA